MGQPEDTHLVSERTEGHIHPQSMSTQKKKIVPEQKLSGKTRCFACNQTSHNLDQCRIKYKLVTVGHQFGYATKFPFVMIQPSEQMLEKEKFYHHCVMITSNISNLDLDIVKGELQSLWKLSGGWVLRRECSKSFLASFRSQGDVVRCLTSPNIETLLDGEEVKLTVTRWREDDDESNDLIKEWFLVSGIPRKYRAWREIYQVASAFGVLIDVDEGTLEVGDKEPIRLKIALRNHDCAPFSYHYVVPWSSRMVMLSVEATLDSENISHSTRIVTSTSNHVLDFEDSSDKEHSKEQKAAQSFSLEDPMCIEGSRLDGKTKENHISTPAEKVHTSKKTAVESSKAEGTQSACTNLTTMIVEDRFKGKPKPPIEHVYKRRGKKEHIADEEISKIPSNNTLDKGMSPENSNATRNGAPEMECKIELNVEEMDLMGVGKKSEEVGAFREKEGVTLAATIIKHVYKRRGKKEHVTDEEMSKSPSNNLDKGMSPENSNATRIGAPEMGCKIELNVEEMDLMGVAKTEEVGAFREKEGVTLAATTIKSEKKMIEDSSKAEGAQSVCRNPTTAIVEDHLKGTHIYKRRGKKEHVTDEEISKSPSNNLDKGMSPDNINATRIGAPEMECKRELNVEEIDLTRVGKKSEEVGAFREKEGVTLAATTINSEKKITEDSSKTDGGKFKNSTTINGEDSFKGITKPPVKYVYKRRGKKQQDSGRNK